VRTASALLAPRSTIRSSTSFPGNAIENELKLSKACLEQELEEEIASSPIPMPFRRKTGISRRCSRNFCARKVTEPVSPTVIGRAQAGDDLFCLRRLPANSCDDRALFVAKLNGAYDWLGPAQHAFQTFQALDDDSVPGSSQRQ